jgi:hypothetical protein
MPTQPDAVIGHGEVESQLRALHVQKIASLFGRMVWRVDLRHWRVDGSPPLLLLPAIDKLMSRRAVLCYHERHRIEARLQPAATEDR